MANQVMRITLKAYDHQLVDASAKKIIETVKKNGSQVSGPVPLPTKKEVVTILRAVHKYKDSREQFEQRTHKRLIDIITPTSKTVEALQSHRRTSSRTQARRHPTRLRPFVALALRRHTPTDSPRTAGVYRLPPHRGKRENRPQEPRGWFPSVNTGLP